MLHDRLRAGLLALAAILLVAIAARHAVRSWLTRPVHYGEAMHAVPVTSLHGQPVWLEPRPGHALLINVFAGWCVPCRDELPALARVAPRLEREGFDVVGIDQAESPAQVERVAQAYGLRYPTYIDVDRNTQAILGARIIPTTIVVDRHAVVRFVHAGPLDASGFLDAAEATQ